MHGDCGENSHGWTLNRHGFWLVGAVVVASAALFAGCTSDRSADSTARGGEEPRTSIPLSEGFCAAAIPVVEMITADSPEELEAFYSQLDGVRVVLVDESPEELAEDVGEFLAGVDAARPAMEAADYDASSLDASEVSGYDAGRVQAAGARITEYVDGTCLEGGSTENGSAETEDRSTEAESDDPTSNLNKGGSEPPPATEDADEVPSSPADEPTAAS